MAEAPKKKSSAKPPSYHAEKHLGKQAEFFSLCVGLPPTDRELLTNLFCGLRQVVRNYEQALNATPGDVYDLLVKIGASKRAMEALLGGAAAPAPQVPQAEPPAPAAREAPTPPAPPAPPTPPIRSTPVGAGVGAPGPSASEQIGL